MQATLVAYYGKKPAELSNLIREVQGTLIGVLSDAYFYPYDIQQVHSTIIGMEGMPKDKTIINKNFQALRGELRPMDVDNAVKFIRTTSMMPMRIRVCGFKKSTDYGFKSFGVHPYHRSFSIQTRHLSGRKFRRASGRFLAYTATNFRSLPLLILPNSSHKPANTK
jgi:hypothetical protein